MSDQPRPTETPAPEHAGGTTTATAATEPLHGAGTTAAGPYEQDAAPGPGPQESVAGWQGTPAWQGAPAGAPGGAPAWQGQAAWQGAPGGAPGGATPAPARGSVWRRLPWLLPVVVGVAALVVGLVGGGAAGFAAGSVLGGAGRPAISVGGPGLGGPGATWQLPDGGDQSGR